MSVHASAYFELMHYKRVIVNWLCDNAYAYIKPESTGRVYRFRVQKRHTARSRLQEQYTWKGHGVIPVPCIPLLKSGPLAGPKSESVALANVVASWRWPRMLYAVSGHWHRVTAVE